MDHDSQHRILVEDLDSHYYRWILDFRAAPRLLLTRAWQQPGPREGLAMFPDISLEIVDAALSACPRQEIEGLRNAASACPG